MGRTISWAANIQPKNKTHEDQMLRFTWKGGDTIMVRIDKDEKTFLYIEVPLRDFGFYIREFIDVTDAVRE